MFTISKFFSRKFALLIMVGVLTACQWQEGKGESLVEDGTAIRAPGETYQQAEERYRRTLDALKLESYLNTLSVMSQAVPIEQLDTSTLRSFGSQADLEAAFVRGRDYRFLSDPTEPGLLRRLTWLYPDDGCFARADLLIRNLTSWGYNALKKIFVFGELAVESANAPSGTSYWWFHIVPITAADDVPYVLDPAVEANGPMTLADWLAAIVPVGQEVKASICEPYAYIPYSRCQGVSDPGGQRSLNDQMGFLDAERQRIAELGRSPEGELGDSPPWLANFAVLEK